MIAAANVNQPKGNFDGPERSFMLDANDQLRSPEAYRDLIIAYRDGAPLRLADVADVVDGAENSRLAAWANELPAVLVNVQRQPGANVIDVVDRISALLPQLTASLPSTLTVAVLSDRTDTIRASVTRRAARADVRRRRWSCSSPSCSCATSPPRSSRASSCRCR